MIYHVGVAWWDVFLLGDAPPTKTARGLVRVAQHVHQFYGGESRRVAVHQWSDSMESLAQQILALTPERFGELGRSPALKIYASGLGAAAALHLAALVPELSVETILVAQPVWLPGQRQPELPQNVIEVDGFVSAREGWTWPTPSHDGQRVEPPTKVQLSPEAIEGLSAFQSRCLEAARS